MRGELGWQGHGGGERTLMRINEELLRLTDDEADTDGGGGKDRCLWPECLWEGGAKLGFTLDN